jgi:hypothetical protein
VFKVVPYGVKELLTSWLPSWLWSFKEFHFVNFTSQCAKESTTFQSPSQLWSLGQLSFVRFVLQILVLVFHVFLCLGSFFHVWALIGVLISLSSKWEFICKSSICYCMLFLLKLNSPYSKLKYYKNEIKIDWPTWKAKNLGPSFIFHNK